MSKILCQPGTFEELLDMLVNGQAVLDMAGQESTRENAEGGNINGSSPLCSCGQNLEHGYKTSIGVYGHQSRGEVMMTSYQWRQ